MWIRCEDAFEPDLVSVGVLDDQPIEHFGIPADDPESYRAAVVLYARREPGRIQQGDGPQSPVLDLPTNRR
jgi:hypothetical protein